MTDPSERRDWRDPRDGQLWIVTREAGDPATRLSFRKVDAPPEEVISTAIPEEVQLMRLSDGRLTELLDDAQASDRRG